MGQLPSKGVMSPAPWGKEEATGSLGEHEQGVLKIGRMETQVWHPTKTEPQGNHAQLNFQNGVPMWEAHQESPSCLLLKQLTAERVLHNWSPKPVLFPNGHLLSHRRSAKVTVTGSDPLNNKVGSKASALRQLAVPSSLTERNNPLLFGETLEGSLVIIGQTPTLHWPAR